MVVRAARGLVAAAIVSSSIVAASDAHAYCRTTTCDPRTIDCPRDENGCLASGAPLTWRSLPLTYRFHAGGSEKLDMDRARDAVRAAFDTWSNVRCNGSRTSLRFAEGPDIRTAKPAGPGKRAKEPFGIYFRDDAWPYDDADESLALTNQQFGEINGYVDYADIEINTAQEAFAVEDGQGGFDLQAVLTHEVGHYIGLAHSRVKDSIMVARYCQSDKRCGGGSDAARALADDDIRAVCAMYPPGGIAGVRYEEPSSGCAASPSRDVSFAVPAVAAAFAIAIVRRRRAREG